MIPKRKVFIISLFGSGSLVSCLNQNINQTMIGKKPPIATKNHISFIIVL
ncbi:MAG: hypothetical protein LRZ98_01285 [Candidatus Pacebacteria bacterium]|nr:hypothetical protein [Candidatus Paceibacterota bacterium]